MKNPAAKRIGRLLGLGYKSWQVQTYARLALSGHPKLRQSHSPVFRFIEPNGSRIVDLAAKAGMTKQSMTYLVRSLESAGYVVTTPDPADGRARLVNLTDAGIDAEAALARISLDLEAELVLRLDEEKVERLRALLAELLDE